MNTTRRDVLKHTTLAAASMVANDVRAGRDASEDAIIDTNVSLFHWPFRRLPLDETGLLVNKLHSLGVTQAWAGSYEGLLHRDISSVNSRLAAECKKHSMLIPVGTINPTLDGWQRDVRQCRTDHDIRVLRLHPNYHGYTLADPIFTQCLKLARDERLLVQITAALEDTRTQHEKLQTPDVDLAPLRKVLPQISGAFVQILNYRPRGSQQVELGKLPGVYFDTARVESTDGVPKLVSSLPDGRVLFGSHAPFLIPEAALIRVHESGQLNVAGVRAVLSANAAKLWKGFDNG